MGTGKTTIAKRLAGKAGMKYISTDELIEKKEGMAISEIFAKKGEPYFRAVERAVVLSASSEDNVIIDAGGGAVVDPDNVSNMKKNGILVSLWAEPEVIYERTKQFNHRPLLNVDDPLRQISELLAKRKPYYERADYHLNTGQMSIDEAVDAVIEYFRKKYAKGPS